MILDDKKIRFATNGILALYALIVSFALAFDLLTDLSFGALMLSTLPIGLLCGACLLVGPWFERRHNRLFLRNWLIGMLFILAISLVFSNLGFEQAKTGELLATYALLVSSFPSSLALPFAMMWIESTHSNSIWLRIVFAWAVCVGMGLGEWGGLLLLGKKLRRR